MSGALVPDWDSIESVRSAHNALSAGALLFFAALVLFDVLAHMAEDTHKERARFLEKIGLICFAVAIFAEILAYPYSRRNDTLSSQQGRKSAEKIAALDHFTEALRTDAAKARAETEAMKRTAKGFERDIAIAKKDAAEANLARARIEEAIAWRRLSDEEQARLANRLRRFSGHTVSLWYQAFDTEGSLFAADIAAAMGKAGWRVFPPASMLTMAESTRIGDPITHIETGVEVQSTTHTSSKEAADALAEGLNGLGFDATRRQEPDRDPRPQVWININPRPQGSQGRAKLRKNR